MLAYLTLTVKKRKTFGYFSINVSSVGTYKVLTQTRRCFVEKTLEPIGILQHFKNNFSSSNKCLKHADFYDIPICPKELPG